jgi:DNA polymerase
VTLYIDLDFETCSAAELKECGAWAYAEHPTTEILCLRYSMDGWSSTEEWMPGHEIHPLYMLCQYGGPIFVAHNAGFEQAIWSCIMVERFGFPPIPVERWEDTMATAAWKALPLALEKGAAALRLPIEKDKEGNRLTLAMSRVDKKTGMLPERTPERMARISSYCAKDVEVETGMRHRIGLLSQQSRQERQVWLYDQTINQRGVRIDLEFVRQAQFVIERATKPLLAEFRELTGGVNPGQVAKVKEWAAGHGVELESLRKEYLTGLLDGEEDDDLYPSLASEDDDYGGGVQEAKPTVSEANRHLFEGSEAAGGTEPLLPVGMPDTVRRALEIRQMLGSASIKKLARMRQCVGEDGRVRGLLQYHAAGTGRWGGRLLQPQNFPRGTLDKSIDPDAAVEAIMSGDPDYVELVLGRPAIECVASSLRHALVPDPGKVFLVGDFAGIEARIVLAMAGQHDKVALMAEGHDVYLDMASVIFGETVEKGDPRRQYGKNGVLGCGFQCGAINFNQKFLGGKDLDLAYKTVGAYRKDWAPEVPTMWYALDKAALRAAQGSRRVHAYGVEYNLEDGWLTAKLPSGWQKLWYYDPQLGRDDRFDRECWLYSAYKGGKHQKIKAYGGLLTENAVQGLARGLLCAAIDRLERSNMPVVLTVHDEAVCEVDEDKADLKLFEQVMSEPTRWAQEMRIPVAVEVWQGTRYRK